MTLNIAVIGAGVMGADHARIIAEEMAGARLALVCDAAAERAGQVAARFGAAATTDPLAAIAAADVDAVVIASPDATHAALARACIAAGKPALCEKPLSQRAEECLAVAAAEQAAGRRLVQVGFMRRFDPSYAAMKAGLDAGQIGRALLMHNIHRNVENPAADFTADMAITNAAPHEFDAARHVLGQDFTAISAFAPDRPDRPDGRAPVGPVLLVLQTGAGQVVTVEVNVNAAYGYDVRAELTGETGALSFGNPVVIARDAALARSTAYAADWRPRFAEAYRRQMAAFVRFAATGAFPPAAADAWDGYLAALVAECGVRARRAGGRIAIAPAARPALYAAK